MRGKCAKAMSTWCKVATKLTWRSAANPTKACMAMRARIGSRSLVGAGALVTEGKVFEDGKLILGTPAKVTSELTAEQMQGLETSAQTYVANAARYRKELKIL